MVTVKIFFVLLGAAAAIKLPDHFKVCKRNDPKRNECLKEAIRESVHSIEDGSKDLEIPSLNPLIIKEAEFIQDRTSNNLHLKMKYNNMHMYGLNKIEIEEVNSNFEDDNNLFMQAIALTSNVTMVGQYEMTGKLLLLPVKGSGDVRTYCEDVKGNVTLHFNKKTVKGEEYILLKDVSYDLMSMKKIELHYSDLFKGNKELSEKLNFAMNQNWKLLIEAFKPSIGKFFASLFRGVSTALFSHVPYKQLLPE